MEAIKQTLTVPKSRELRIKLPANAIADEPAEIIVLFRVKPTGLAKKIAELESAAQDALYLADINEVQKDFQFADAEVK